MTNTPDNDRHEREWRDMSTAPVERGARILGWCVYPAGAECRIVVNSPPYMSPKGAIRWEAYGISQNVTHWMPLPPKPHHFNQEGK